MRAEMPWTGMMCPCRISASCSAWRIGRRSPTGLLLPARSFEIEPYVRFKGQPGEQATMFFRDPSGNAIEMKAFEDLGQLFAK